MLSFNPAPKPSYPRSKPTRKQQGAITPRVRQEVLRRSGGCCEKCGRTTSYAFEMAHLIQRSQGGSGKEPWNIALLCGPSVNTGTCHNQIDYTKKGRIWALEFREKLKAQYEQGGGLLGGNSTSM